MLKCIIHEQKLSVFMPDAAGGSFNYLTATFSFTPDWEGTTARWAHFRQDNTAYDIEIRADCIEAEQGLNLGGGLWQMWLSGHKVDDQGVETQTITTTTVWLNLSEIPADGDGTSFPTVNPDAAAAILTQCAAARDSAEESANMAMQAQEAAEAAQKAAENARDEVINGGGGGTGGEAGPGGAVISVNGKTGAVILTAADVGALPADTPLFDGNYNSLSNKPTIPTLPGWVGNEKPVYTAAEIADGDSNVGTEIIQLKEDLAGKADKTDIPTSLPNPNALTFTGAATGNYDGSSALVINIPTGGGGAVSSVNGQTGEVYLSAADVGALSTDTPVVKDTDYATIGKAGVIKPSANYCFNVATNGVPNAYTMSVNSYDTASSGCFISKGTLDNILPEKINGAISRPNLLDNWYFGNPVNQREKTRYSGADYGFDRWRTNFSGDTVEKTDNGIKNTVASTSSGWHLHQRLEIDSGWIGKTVTASLLVAECQGTGTYLQISCRDSSTIELRSRRTALSQGIVSLNIEIATNCRYIYVGMYSSSGVQVGDFLELQAAKLEFGTEQTLAHQENGAWVLNEIPDYGEQLRRCQRFFRKLGGASAYDAALNGYISNGNKVLILNSGLDGMRIAPTVTITPELGTSPSGIVIRTGSGYVSDASFTNPYSTPVFVGYNRGQTLIVQKNDTSAWIDVGDNMPASMSMRNSSLYLSADL